MKVNILFPVKRISKSSNLSGKLSSQVTRVRCYGTPTVRGLIIFSNGVQINPVDVPLHRLRDVKIISFVGIYR